MHFQKNICFVFLLLTIDQSNLAVSLFINKSKRVARVVYAVMLLHRMFSSNLHTYLLHKVSYDLLSCISD